MPLYLWPKGADLAQVKAAVLATELPFKVKPFWFTPGQHERCIVIGEVGDLPILADYVRPKSQAAHEKAVRWFFGLEELPVVHTGLSRMQAIFGDDIVELESKELSPFDYQTEKQEWTWP